MRSALVFVVIIVSSLMDCYARSYDGKILDAISSADWLKLDSICMETPKDSISPFLEVYSRGLIAHYLNKTDKSINAFNELLVSYADSLDSDHLLNTALMIGMDLSRLGKNSDAAACLSRILKARGKSLNASGKSTLKNYIRLYTQLSGYNPYVISCEGETGLIPFKVVPVGKPERGSVLMQLDGSYINGFEASITFDTGAAVNIISESLARKFNLKPLKAHASLTGIGRRKARYAIADEMRIGNMSVKDVPFLITDLKTDHAEANQYIDCFSIVIGSELMLHLKDITIDFSKCEITIPSNSPTVSADKANMYLSRSMNLITDGFLHNEEMRIKIDTGDTSYGSVCGRFFSDNKEYILANSIPDTVRTVGIGGVRISECYRLTDVSLTVGGCSVRLPDINVYKGDNPIPSSEYECNLGLKSLMRFAKICFNMVDFTFSAIPFNLYP